MFLQNSLLVERAVKLKTAREISLSVLPCTNLGTAHNDAFTSRDIMNVARLIAEVTITIMTMKNSKVKKRKRNVLDSGNNDHSLSDPMGTDLTLAFFVSFSFSFFSFFFFFFFFSFSFRL